MGSFSWPRSAEDLESALRSASNALLFCHIEAPMWYANEVAVITGRGTRYRAQELVQLDLSALSELVVIGCGSGRPDMFVGDLTVAHAAALAGASEILYSLWPLRPKHGAEFVHDLVEARSVGAATKEFLASLYANRIVRASPFGLMRASAPTE